MILCFMISMVFYDFMIQITCLAEPLAPHRPPASRRASLCLRSPGATCLHVSRPAGQHHSGYAPDRLVARSTASIVNSRRLVSRKIGCCAAAALARHAGIAHNHDGLGVKVSVGWSDEAQDQGRKRKCNYRGGRGDSESPGAQSESAADGPGCLC